MAHTVCVRSIVISDLHLGDPFQCDLMRYEWVRERFWPLLEGADSLILLGDTWELSFQHMSEALTASKPFFSELSVNFPDINLICVPGNHDHHLVVMATDERRERQALGIPDEDPWGVAPAERILSKLCPSANVGSAYPVFDHQGVVLTHGHYLASHVNHLGWRSFDRLQWWIWRQSPRREGLEAADYESLMSPLYELCYQVAQLPEGVKAQKEIERMFSQVGAAISIPGHLGRQVGHLVSSVRSRVFKGPDPLLGVVSIEQPDASHAELLSAMAAVARNLKLDQISNQLIFGHIHVPMLNQVSADMSDMLFHNCGSFFFDYREAKRPGYWDRCEPGTALSITDGVVDLHHTLTPDDLARMPWRKRYGVGPKGIAALRGKRPGRRREH